MSGMLYQKCSGCDGTLKITTDAGVWNCPCSSSSSPGYLPVGISERQLEAMAVTAQALQGDPGLPQSEADAALAKVREQMARLDRIAAEEFAKIAVDK